MAAWVKALLLSLSAWLYPGAFVGGDVSHFADVVARVVAEHGGGPEVAAELSVLFMTEGHGDPRAVGGDAFGKSYGGWQVHETTLRRYAERNPVLRFLSDEELMFDPWANCSLAADLLVESHRVCASRPPEEQLGWYASGGNGCSVPEGLEASRVRMAIMRRLLWEHPYFYVPEPIWVDRSPGRFPKKNLERRLSRSEE